MNFKINFKQNKKKLKKNKEKLKNIFLINSKMKKMVIKNQKKLAVCLNKTIEF